VESFETWKAPWERKGEDFDAETAKKYVYNVLSEREQLEAQKAQVAQERDALKTKVDEFETKDLSEVERLKRENEALKSKPVEDEEAKLENHRLRLAIEHGLTLKQADRLRGKTPEELESDVQELKELLGEQKKAPKEAPPSGNFSTGNEPDDLEDDLDPEKAASFFA